MYTNHRDRVNRGSERYRRGYGRVNQEGFSRQAESVCRHGCCVCFHWQASSLRSHILSGHTVMIYALLQAGPADNAREAFIPNNPAAAADGQQHQQQFGPAGVSSLSNGITVGAGHRIPVQVYNTWASIGVRGGGQIPITK